MDEKSSNGSIIGVIVVILIAIVGYLAYSQGYFSAKTEVEDDTSQGVEINLGGNTNTSPSNPY